jgi:hypothetical protein
MDRLTRYVRPAASIGTVAAMAMIWVSCGGNPAAPSATAGAGAGGSNLRLLLTDAPIDDVEKVNIYFTGVTVKPVGRPPEDLDLELDVNPVDLLTLRNQVTEFAAGVVPPGDYEFIHINIDERRSNLVEKGVQKSLRVPSEEIKILGGFEVGDDQMTTLTLDFDASASLLRLGNGDWLLRPVVVKTGQRADEGQEEEEDEE